MKKSENNKRKLDDAPDAPMDNEEIRHHEQMKVDVRNITTREQFVKFIKTAGPIDIIVKDIAVTRPGARLSIIDADYDGSIKIESLLKKKRVWDDPKTFVSFMHKLLQKEPSDEDANNLIFCLVNQNWNGTSKMERINLGEWLSKMKVEQQPAAPKAEQQPVPKPEPKSEDILDVLLKADQKMSQELSKMGLTMMANFSTAFGVHSTKACQFILDIGELAKQKKYKKSPECST